MLAENRKVKQVLEKLLSSKGADLSVRTFDQVGVDGELENVWNLMARCRLRGDILVGYWLYDHEEPVLNPGDKHVSREWSAKDRLIILNPTKVPLLPRLARCCQALRHHHHHHNHHNHHQPCCTAPCHHPCSSAGPARVPSGSAREASPERCACLQQQVKSSLDLIAEGDMLRKSAGKLSDEHAERKKLLYAEAISMYTKAMNQDPANALAPYGRGVAERKRGDPQAAVDAFRISLALDPQGQGGKLGRCGWV